MGVVDGKLYAVAGVDHTHTSFSSVECFDPLTAQWSRVVAPMGTLRSHVAAVALECPAE